MDFQLIGSVIRMIGRCLGYLAVIANFRTAFLSTARRVRARSILETLRLQERLSRLVAHGVSTTTAANLQGVRYQGSLD